MSDPITTPAEAIEAALVESDRILRDELPGGSRYFAILAVQDEIRALRFRIAPADATPDGHPLLASERSQPAPTRKERCDLRWEIERHLGGVEEWTPSHDLALSTFELLRKCQRTLVQPIAVPPSEAPKVARPQEAKPCEGTQ